MSTSAQTLLGRYHYTALDKLAACTLGAQPSTQRFYLKERLSTEIQGTLQHSIMQHEDQLLAQQQHQAGTLRTQLLATDQQRSVLALLDGTRPQQLAYSPYGHHLPENGLLSLLGFNGERPDPLTGWYLLGNGYRAFNSVLMRFNSPDYLSPFGRGGLNAYGYCVGDPINQSDPTGHMPKFLSKFFSRFGSGIESKSLHSSTSSLDSKLSRTSSSASVGQTQGTVQESDRLLVPKKASDIKKLKDPIERNRAKLENVKSEMANLKNNPDSVVDEYMNQHHDNFIPKEVQAQIVRDAIPGRIEKLEKIERHYIKKLKALKTESSRVRQS